ncbi:MAG: purine-binding chemotaxis protein CheW [Spirochaetales bacterium]|nr:purine-binding chemotaxis protein CheW [Spirochaetales bacterium]
MTVSGDNSIQLVTFQLGKELYGINIMLVNSIVRPERIRHIPNAPHYVEGMYNLRGEIIPVISLHSRFMIEKLEVSEDDAILEGMIIVNVNRKKMGILVDNVKRVVPIPYDKIQPPPMNVAGIRSEYVYGVYRDDKSYLVILDVERIFSQNELQQLQHIGE